MQTTTSTTTGTTTLTGATHHRPEAGRAGLPQTLARRDDVREVLPLAEHLAQAVTWGV